MKKLISILMAALCALTMSTAALADAAADASAKEAAHLRADDVSIFEFVNNYAQSITQPGMSEEELNAMISAQGETIETEHATYAALQSAFDGCTGYVMFKVTPKDPANTQLMSNYMWMPEDVIPLEDDPDSTATFAERAGDGRIVVAGLTLGDRLGKELTDSAACSEKYFSDGTMLLFARFNYNVVTYAARDLDFTLREYVYGEEMSEQTFTVRLEPKVNAEIVRAQGSYAFGGITITDAELVRSPLGMMLRLVGAVDADVDPERMEVLRMSALEVVDDGAFVCGGGMGFCDENGAPVYPDEAAPGSGMHTEIMMGAGTAMPDEMTVGLNTFETDADMPIHTIEFAANQPE